MEEPEVEVTDEQRNAAFEEGLGIARGETPPAVVPDKQAEQNEELPNKQLDEGEEEEKPKEAAAEEAPAEEVIPGLNLTPSEVKAMLASAAEAKEYSAAETRKLHGKFGEIQRELKRLSTGGTAKITKDTFKKLAEAGYEDVAELLAEDLGMMPSAPTVDYDEIDQRFSGKLKESIDAVTAQYETKLLTIRHPDWQQQAASDEWKLFLATQPAEKQAEIGSSNDGLWLAGVFDEFNAWKGRGKEKTNTRLERAVAPKSAPPEPSKKSLNDANAFEDGIKAARKRLGLMR